MNGSVRSTTTAKTITKYEDMILDNTDEKYPTPPKQFHNGPIIPHVTSSTMTTTAIQSKTKGAIGVAARETLREGMEILEGRYEATTHNTEYQSWMRISVTMA